MSTTPMKVTLTGKTRHGKNRVREQGTVHTVQRIERNIFDKKGAWLLLQSDHDGALRWVHATQDDDFEVEVSEAHNG